jgi:hypothetical protein
MMTMLGKKERAHLIQQQLIGIETTQSIGPLCKNEVLQLKHRAVSMSLDSEKRGFIIQKTEEHADMVIH